MAGTALAAAKTVAPAILVGVRNDAGQELIDSLDAAAATKEPDIGKRMGKRRQEGTEASFLVTNKKHETWGGFRVSARNMIRMLKCEEALLLFPGGSKEACKDMKDAYKLWWPDRPEFVRLAAKYGATIIPFAAVGLEDNVATLLSGDTVRSIPYFHQQLSEWYKDKPRARVGVNERVDEFGLDEDFPLVSLNIPAGPPPRMYFKFSRAIELQPEAAADRERCKDVYDEVRAEVEGGIRYILDKRERDPFRDFAARVAYESVVGRQAPTFEL